MTPDERQLIAGLFERMRGFGAPDKDRDAELLIAQQIRAMPDAPYMLVQSVLVQEQALENAQSRIRELEDRQRELEGEPPRKSGGFLGGYWGGRRDQEPRASSVPQAGARAPQSSYDSRQPSPPQGPPPQPQAPSGGGFMRSAISTAAGVAGGMLLADSLRNMLGGGHAASPFSVPSASAEHHGVVSDPQSNSPDDAPDDAAEEPGEPADDAGDEGYDDGDPGYGDDSGEIDV